MIRTNSLTAVCLILALASAAAAQKPFKNKTARDARKTYEEAIAKAKKEYVAKLEFAIKEAGGAGDIDEATRIVAEKKAIAASGPGANLDAVAKLRKRLEGTRWGPRPTVTLKLHPKRKAILSGGGTAVWIVSDPRTILVQDHGSKQITVWKFDARTKSARLYEFEQAKRNNPLVYKKY